MPARVIQRLRAALLLLLLVGTSASLSLRHSPAVAAGSDPIVAFNTASHKFHHPDCDSAKACTRNCVRVRRSEAIVRGGIPCKHCGGGLRLDATHLAD